MTYQSTICLRAGLRKRMEDTPLVEGENFSDEVFNDYEKENLKVLLKILNR